MKIIFVPDVLDWAIGHLVQSKVKHLPQHNCKIIPIHPRDAKEKAEEFLQQIKEFNPDIICYEYFRSAEQLINAQPELKNYKSILVHHNQRDKALYHADWNALGIDRIVTHTNKCREKLEKKGYFNVDTINHGIDLDFFTYKDEEPEELTIGYVGRVCPWKGLKEIAEIGQELGYPVEVMGKPDKMDYWATVPQESLRFNFMDCKDEERPDAYYNMTVYVGNSEDDYEEGTLPYLEAMACGTPVVTTLNGVARDIAQDNNNALVVPFKDKEALKAQIKRIMEDKELRQTLRKNGWNTVKNMPEQKMAWEYSKLFWRVFTKDDLVSVIIPATYDRSSQVEQILVALENQTYKAVEAIVIWDEKEKRNGLGGIDYHISVKQLYTGSEGYNLAMARNIGVIDSIGEYLMFCDSRLSPDEDAITIFTRSLQNLEEKYWLFGDKGSQKKSFVENFSFIRRNDFIKFGMMNERIDSYGGLSQEIRTRWIKQGGKLEYLGLAKAKELMSSKMTDDKRKSIIRQKFKLLKMYEGQNY